MFTSIWDETMTEFNPLNERLKKQYEESLLHDDYRDEKTVDKAWKAKAR